MSDAPSPDLVGDDENPEDLDIDLAVEIHPDQEPVYRPGRPTRDQARLIAQRRGKVELLHLNGASVRTIAREVHVSRSTVNDDLKAIRRRWRHDGAGADLEDERQLELQRLELQRRQLAVVANGNPEANPPTPPDLEAHRVLVQIARRKAALLGLDAPKRIYVAGDGSDPGEGVSTPTLVEMLTSYGEQSAN